MNWVLLIAIVWLVAIALLLWLLWRDKPKPAARPPQVPSGHPNGRCAVGPGVPAYIARDLNLHSLATNPGTKLPPRRRKSDDEIRREFHASSSDDGLLTGMAVGMMLQDSFAQAPEPSPSDTSFAGSGGTFGGAGASGTWDPPIDGGTYSSDSSSSFDSGSSSYDSGSSSSSDF